MLNEILYKTKKFIPKKVFTFFQPTYHYLLSIVGALIYRLPGKKIFIVGITGTKGKTSTAEIVNSILEEAGFKTALAGTLRFKIDQRSTNNKYKMTMPGRFFLQNFLRKAVKAGCQYAVIEMTSEGAKQFRYNLTYPNALIFTNLAPEHIESHGSYENYLKAKLSLAKLVEKSKKPEKILISNIDDKEGAKFLDFDVNTKISYQISDIENKNIKKEGLEFRYQNTDFESPLSGEFNLYNILASIKFTQTQNIGLEIIKNGIKKLNGIRGRVEKIELEDRNPHKNKQDFKVIVDYAHTPDSLEKLYETFSYSKRICVLGNTGGGRDTWKRPVMGKIASDHCSHIILTNEDPYDEDPMQIIDEVASGIENPIFEKILDRREAINKAISLAKTGDTVLITGKGTDPYIMEAENKKTPWSDSQVAKEELNKILRDR